MAYGWSGGPCPGRGGRDSGARPRSGCAVSLYAVGNLPAQHTDVRGNDRYQRAAGGALETRCAQTGPHVALSAGAGRSESSRARTTAQAAFCGEAEASESSPARTREGSGTREGGGPRDTPRTDEPHPIVGAESPRLPQPTPGLEAELVIAVSQGSSRLAAHVTAIGRTPLST